MTILDPPAATAALPYGPVMARLLRPLQRAFLVLNGGFMAPLIRSGYGWLLGSPLGGWYLLLRTRGRRSGLLHEAPLGYVILAGAVYCVAGYGTGTPWYLNLLADPSVEVILPTRRFRGRAEPVTDDTEWVAAYRALIRSFGPLGQGIVGDISRLDDATLLAQHRALPVIRITPSERITPSGSVAPLTAGFFDPGGGGWAFVWGGTVALGVFLLARLRRA